MSHAQLTKTCGTRGGAKKQLASGRANTRNSDTQTDPPEEHSAGVRQVLNQQLQKLQDDYLETSRRERASPTLSSEEQMRVFQAQCEERLRKEIAAETERIKEHEVAKAVLAEQARHRAEIEAMRREARARARASRCARLGSLPSPYF